MWPSVEFPLRPFVTPRLTREHVGEFNQRVCCRGGYGGRCPHLKWRPKLRAACANRKAARATNEATSCVELHHSVGRIESQKLDSELRISDAVFTAQQDAGIKQDATFDVSGRAPQSAYTPFVQAMKDSGVVRTSSPGPSGSTTSGSATWCSSVPTR